VSKKPDNVLQFRSPRMTPAEHNRIREYYFGGCGPNQNFWPKRHKWGMWQFGRIAVTGARFKQRTCKICAEVSDYVFLDDPGE